MPLPPLADLDAVRDLLAEPLSSAQEARAVRVLAAISAEVRAVTARTWTTPAGELDPTRPDLLAVTTERATERALRNPQGLLAEGLGDYSRRFADGAGGGTPGVYLTAAERAALAALVDVGDIVSVPTERDVIAWPARYDDLDPWGWLAVLFPHTVYVYPSTSRTDIDGNTIRWADLDRLSLPVPAFVQPRTSAETEAGPGQRARVELTGYLSHFAPPLDPWCAIEYENTVYEIVGYPAEHRNLSGELRYTKVHMRATDWG